MSHPSQRTRLLVSCDRPHVALYPSKTSASFAALRIKRSRGKDDTSIGESFARCEVEHGDAVMIRVLKGLLGRFSRERPGKRPTAIQGPKRLKSTGNFRAVEIAPSLICCTAATQVTGRLFLSREAPRLPLVGCTMPTSCACKFRKNADRRDSDRRLFGATETNRWFAGVDSRKSAGRRSAEP